MSGRALPKLFYFDGAGRGDMIRLAFRIGDIPFEDVRFAHEQWPVEYKHRSPAGQAPWIELPDGRKICESLACLMYAATLSGLVPSDPLMNAFAEQAMSAVFGCGAVFRQLMDDPKATSLVQDLQGRLAKLDKHVARTQGPEGFTVGSQLTYADVAIFTFLKKALPHYLPGVSEQLLQAAPAINRICQATENHPKVRAFYAH